MSATFLMKTKPRVFTRPEETAWNDLLTTPNKCGFEPVEVGALAALFGAGLSWFQILQLVFKYGPLISTMANTIITALRSSGGLTLDMLNLWVNTYGPAVSEMVKEILSALGLSLPS